ncbi:DUF916 and DUF3324 domain-containing protein [Listeria kieliensis]|uniref:Cell surface protein n=1 Tax=Listeria kieliensis TaxID=1621700 RepID=A0A3D8TQ13_9LIST|nr:DUF916 and DUF3324 domain-containing protein [Listeria kieliensis]RDX00787.1 cell surface protein [Listeria kieliensis]
MKLKIKKIIALVVVGLASVLLLAKPAAAAEMNFAVQAIIPENQVDKSQTYFDLRMKPGQKQDIEVELRNDTKKDVTVEIQANTAITNDNGVVEYSGPRKKKDSSLKVDFKKIAEVQKEAKLKSGTSQKVKVHLKMPNQLFDGVVLGGLYFTEKEDDSNKTKDKKNENQIINRYAYTIGVQLTETDKQVKPNLVLNSVKPTQINFRNAISANIQNDQAAIIKDMTIEAKIYKKGKSDALYHTVQKNLRMAPNSNFNFGVGLDNKPFKPGKYVFKGVAKIGDKKWILNKEFTIQDKEAKDFNNKAVQLEKDYTWIYVLVGSIVIIILLAIISYLIYRLKRKSKGK